MRPMSNTATSRRLRASSSNDESYARREHRRTQVVVRESGKGDGIEPLPFPWVGFVDVDAQRVMFGVDARRRHGNQTTFVEEPTPVDDQVTNTPLSRIDDHAVERADLDASLSANMENLDK